MANGDLTKTTEYDKIEVVNSWNIQVRAASVVSEEQADGSLTELSRSFHRHVLTPFNSAYTAAVEAEDAVSEVTDSDGNVTTPAKDAISASDASWEHTATDISGEAAQVQAITNAAWTDAVKDACKAAAEAQPQL
jgi:hypothetical protein